MIKISFTFLNIRRMSSVYYCYGDISYHAPKMESSQPKHILRACSLGEDNFSFLTRYLTSRERLVLPLYEFLLSANTITFTYHPLFELFFHRSYLKTTTIIYIYVCVCVCECVSNRSRERHKCSIFISYHTKALLMSRLIFLDCSNLPLTCTLKCWVLSKVA